MCHEADEALVWPGHAARNALRAGGSSAGRIPPGLLGAAMLGAWLMFSPLALGSGGAAAAADHLLGPLILTVSVIATAEVLRPARLLTAVLGLAVIGSTLLLAGGTTASLASGLLVGVATIALSVPRGPILQRYGGLERRLR